MLIQSKKFWLVLFLAAIFGSVFGVCPAMADIKLAWEQSDIGDNFWGWEVHTASTPGGPYTMSTEIQYGGEAQADYRWVIDPAEFSGMTYFVVKARNTAGQVSEPSNEVSYLFSAPMVPVNLRIVLASPIEDDL